MKRKIALEVSAFSLAILFLYSSANKIIDYQKFSVQIGQSPLLTGWGGSIPWMVITAEIVTSVFLFIPKYRFYAFFASLSLMVMFTAYIVAILNFSSFIPCSCGGVLEKLSWSDHLVFNAGFVLISLAGIILQAEETKRNETAVVTKNLTA